MTNAMVRSGRGVYFDGMTSARHTVTIDLETAALRIAGDDNGVYVRWPYAELQNLSAPEGLLRLGRAGSRALERLEIRDSALAEAIDDRSVPVDRSGASEHRTRKRIVAWSFAAVASLMAVAVYGLPMLADRIAPYVPMQFERWFGDAMDGQARAMLDTDDSGQPFECGTTDEDKPARAALDKLVNKLESGAQLPIPLRVIAVRRPEANAITLPGGHIYVFEGLISKSENVHELAGVMAHEIGHVAHRDGTRNVLQSAGLSFLFGMMLGDFVGGGAVVVAAKTVLNSSYSREAETGADRYGVELMNRIGGDARALGTILERIAGAVHPGMKILLDHPETRQRVAAINAFSSPNKVSPLLTEAEWASLKRICSRN